MADVNRPIGGEEPPGVSTPPQLRTGAGTPVIARIVLTNRAPEPRIMSVTALGVDASWLPRPSRSRPVLPGQSLAVDIALSPALGTVPARYPLAIAVQALEPASQQASSPTVLAELELVIDAPGQIAVTLSPVDTTAVFRHRIQVVLRNTAGTPAVVDLDVRSPHSTRVRLDAQQVEVGPGQTVPVSGRVAVRRAKLFGPKARHAFTITARTGGAPRHAEGSFTSRAVFGPGGTKVVALLAIVAVWVALAIVFIPKLADSQRNKQALAGPSSSTSSSGGGSSTPGAPGKSGGSGGSGGPGGSAGTGGGAGSATAKTVQLNGTMAGNASGGVTVSMAPTSLVDEQAATATPVGVSPDSVGAPGMLTAESLTQVSTTRDRSTVTAADGAWSFAGVPKPGYYLVTFAKPGYQTQRYIIDSSAAIATQPLNVTLVPGQGELSGRVSGPSGPVGGAQVTITDGTNTITTTSNSKGDVGSWTVNGLSTPSDYLVSAGLAGLGTESALVHLGAGAQASVSLTLKAGVAAIIGTVTAAAGGGLGGVSVTATDGTTTRTATTVTVDGLRGRYTLSDLPAPGSYTITFAGTGFLPQTVSVKLVKGQSRARVDVALFPSSATVAGSVFGDLLDQSGNTTGTGPLVGAGLILTSPDQTYKTTSGVDGSYRFDGVAPGDYVLTAQYAGLGTMYKSVKVPAGSTAVVAVAPFHLTKPPDLANTATIVGFVGDGTNPGNTLCPLTPGTCSVQFKLVGSDGTEYGLTPASVPTAPFGPTGYTLTPKALTKNIQPGLYRLTLSSANYLPATVSVQLPLTGVATAPQVSLYPANSIHGTVQASGNLNDNGTGTTYTNCVYVMPIGQAPPSTTACVPGQLAPSNCTVSGQIGPAYAAVADDGSYTVPNLCDGAYTVYFVITNPWYINSVTPVNVALSHGQDFPLSVQVATYGKVSVTLGQLNSTGSATIALPSGTVVTVACTGPGGSTITPPPVTGDGARNTAYTFGGFTPGPWTCTGTATGFNDASTGQLTVGNGELVHADLVFTHAAGTFVGRQVTSWSGSPAGVAGGQVVVTGVTGYVNGAAQTTSVTATPDAAGCFAVSPTGSLPSGFTAPGACATDPDLAASTVRLPLVVATATFQVSPPGGYQTPGTFSNLPLDSSVLTTLSIQPNPVALSSGTLATDPATTSGLSAFTLKVTASPPGAGTVTVTADDATGALSWQDSGLPAGQIAPGTYTIVASRTNYVTTTFTVTCQPNTDCALGTLTVDKLGGLTVNTTADGSTAVADPIVSLLSASGTVLQTQTALAGTNSVTFTGLTPGTTYAVRVHAAGYQFGDSSGGSPLVTLSCDNGGASIAILPGDTPTTCTATLTRDGAIAGTADGVLAAAPATSPTQPLAGAHVTATRCGNQTTTCDGTPGISFSTVADGDGNFRVSGSNSTQGLDPGYWLLAITAPGFSAPAGGGFVVHVTSTATDTSQALPYLLYASPVTVSATLLDQHGKVVDDIGQVQLLVNQQVVATATQVPAHGQTPTTYQFTNVIPGSYSLQASGGGYNLAALDITVTLAPPSTQTFTLPVVSGASLVQGTVTGVQGSDAIATALGGATVCLIKSGQSGTCAGKAANGNDGNALVTTTGANGGFAFGTVRDGAYFLQAERYGYVVADGPVVTYDHLTIQPATTLPMTRVTQTVTVVVTASSASDDITGSSAATLTSAAAGGAVPGNATLSNLSITTGADKHTYTVTVTQVPYGCWAFSATSALNHYGTLGAPTTSTTDTTLNCGAGFFPVPGTGSAGVSVNYTLSEYQPSLTVTATPVAGDTALTTVTLTATDGGSTTYLSATPFTVGGPTRLGFWVPPSVTVHASVTTGNVAWPGGSTTMSNATNKTIALTELAATIKVTATLAADGTVVSGATVSLTAPSGLTAPANKVTDASGIATFTVPYGTGWSAKATKSALSGTSGSFDTSATEADVSITMS